MAYLCTCYNSSCGFHPVSPSLVVLVGERGLLNLISASPIPSTVSLSRLDALPGHLYCLQWNLFLDSYQTSTGRFPWMKANKQKQCLFLEEGLVRPNFISAASDLQPQAKESTLDPQPGWELGHQRSVSGKASLALLK